MTLLRNYVALAKVALAVQWQYRASAVIWLIGAVIQPLVYMTVWVRVAEAQGGTLGTYGAADFAAYYLVGMYVNHLTFTWIMWEYDWIIRNGDMSRLLLRPIHPIHGDIADNIVYKAFGLVFLMPAGVLLAWTYPPRFELAAWHVIAAVMALGLAFVLRFLLGWSLAMVAFFTDRNAAANSMYFVAQLFFAGNLVPLELLPGPLLTVANLLPFRWYYAFVVELFLGRVPVGEAWLGMVAQLGWIAAAFLLMRTLWRAGVRRYGAYGS